MRQVGFILQCQCVCLKLLYEYNDAHLRQITRTSNIAEIQRTKHKVTNLIMKLTSAIKFS